VHGAADWRQELQLDPALFTYGGGDGTITSKVVELAVGDTVDVGVAYKDMSGEISATAWPSGFASAADPNGPFLSSSTGVILPARLPQSTASSCTESTIAYNASAVQLLAAAVGRLGVIIRNTSSFTLYIGTDNTVTPTITGFDLSGQATSSPINASANNGTAGCDATHSITATASSTTTGPVAITAAVDCASDSSNCGAPSGCCVAIGAPTGYTSAQAVASFNSSLGHVGVYYDLYATGGSGSIGPSWGTPTNGHAQTIVVTSASIMAVTIRRSRSSC
jgi:hypothetical protein